MTPKQEALNAIDTARKMLATPDPITGLQLSLLRATLDHACDAVEEIVEVKRVRRAPQAKL